MTEYDAEKSEIKYVLIAGLFLGGIIFGYTGYQYGASEQQKKHDEKINKLETMLNEKVLDDESKKEIINFLRKD